ncbi:SAM-dependent methyltransferase [Campylobacter sp. RM12647]|uniref:SAM-dependent methyltransferase n=1 Tax=Campylobacter sp. RM12647 TaxID=2735737 RepID=UPI001DA89B80|nr:methyltransferase domain-containing protein [Campylobacter sp. RM12647]
MKSFLRAKDTYFKNAIVQNDMREVLLSEINGRFDRVLELGSNRGEFSKMVAKKIEFSEFYCVDINDFSCDYGKEFIFVKHDLRDFENSFLAKMDFDLVISNACFQWLDLAKLINEIPKSNSKLIFSTFGVNNLWQINEHFGVGLEYLNIDEIEQILKPHYKNIKIFEKDYELNFSSSIELFRHLKLSGVNAFSGVFLGKNDLKIFNDKYHNTLNYHAIFVSANN